jgi:hypothetical protein
MLDLVLRYHASRGTEGAARYFFGGRFGSAETPFSPSQQGEGSG